LNAYNIFFYIIRQRLLQKREDEGTLSLVGNPKGDFVLVVPIDIAEAEVERYFPCATDDVPPPILSSQKGLLSFRLLGKFIGAAWQRLDGTSRGVLQHRAQRFADDYRAAMEQWHQAKLKREEELREEAFLKEFSSKKERVVLPMVPWRGKMLPKPRTRRKEVSSLVHPVKNNNCTSPKVQGKVLPPGLLSDETALPVLQPAPVDEDRERRRAVPDEANACQKKKMRCSPAPNTPELRSSSPALLLVDPLALCHPPPDVVPLRLHWSDGNVLHFSQEVSQLRSEVSSVATHTRRANPTIGVSSRTSPSALDPLTGVASTSWWSVEDGRSTGSSSRGAAADQVPLPAES
jgi:hypothetical protein